MIGHKIYTTGQAAEILGIHKNTIFYWEKTGKIKPRRDSFMGYRYWTDGDIEEMKKLSDTIRSRIFETYRGKKIYVNSPKEEQWKYQILFFNYDKNSTVTKMFSSRGMFPTKEEALEKAKKSIDRRLT